MICKISLKVWTGLAIAIIAGSSFGQMSQVSAGSGGVQGNADPSINGTKNGLSTISMAANATAGQQSSSANNNQLKMNADGSGRTFSGTSAGAQGGNSSAQGTVNGSSTGYQAGSTNGTANWTQNSTVSGEGTDAGSGTFDPWVLTYGDFQTTGNTDVSVYFQAVLRKNDTILDPSNGFLPSMELSAYYSTPSDSTKILKIGASMVGDALNLTYDFSGLANPNVHVYLLDHAAYESTASIDSKLQGFSPASPTQIQSAWSSAWNTQFASPLAVLKNDLYFGFKIDKIHLGPGGGNDVAVDLHADSRGNINSPVPEPASIVALGLGLVGFLRRRKAA